MKLRKHFLGLGLCIILPLFGFTVTAQEQVFATQVLAEDHVSNSNLAIDENLGTRAEIESSSGVIIGVGAYDGFLELGFTNPIPANTTTFLKIQTEDDLLNVLLSGGLGNLLADVLGVVLIGNQEFEVQAKSNSTVVLSADSVDPTTFDSARVRIVTDAFGEFYIAITPNVSYNRIYIANRLGSILGLGNTRDLDVFGAYYATGTASCNLAAFTAYDGDGLSLDLLQIGGAGVENPENAIDADATTFSEMNLGILNVAASIEQIVYFDRPSLADEDFKVGLSLSPDLIALGLLDNIILEAYNGSTLVSSSSASSLLSLDLLGLLQSGAVAQVPFEVAGPADRIVVRLSSLLGVNLFQSLNLHGIVITPSIPEIDPASQNLELCEGETANLVATTDSAGAELRWYDAPVGGNLLATVPSGTAFETPALTEDTTFYVVSYLAGCTEESGRIAVPVGVNPIPTSGDINILGLDLPICIPEILNIIPTTSLNGSFRYFLDASGTTEITNGLVQGDLTYTINSSGQLEVEGLVENDTPFRVYVSLVNAVTGCENRPGDLKVVEVNLDGGPQPTIDLNPISDDNILNAAEIASQVTISGTVGGDAEVGDAIRVWINTFSFETTVQAGLVFAVDVPGVQLQSDDDLTIEAEVTSRNLLLCETTVQTSLAYSIDTTPPTIPAVNFLVTNDTTPTITGTADSADDLTVTVGGVTYTEGDGNLTDNGDDTWTLNVPTALGDSTYDVMATATDTAGNSSTDETIDELTIDTIAPTVPTVNFQETSDTTPVITGTADTVDNLSVQVNGNTYSEADGDLVDNGNNTWTLTIPNGNELADGTYDVMATATDAAGNTSSDVTVDELTIDTTLSTTPSVVPLVTTNTSPTLTGTADSGDALTVTVDGVTYTEGDGDLTDNGDDTWTLDVPVVLAEGIYDVTATVTRAGLSATDPTSGELVIDLTPPTVPTVDVLVTNDNTPTITGTADSADDLTVTVDGVTYIEGDGNLVDNWDNTWTLNVPTALADGTYDVMATATDVAGNISTDATTDELTIDTMAPTAPTVTPLVTNDNTPTITGTADSADDLTVTLDGVTYTEGDGNLTDNGNNTWTLEVPSPLADGTYDVDATATDAAGNISTDATTDELTIDTMAPTVPTVDALVTNDTTPTITGTADSADDLTVTLDGITYTEGDGNLTDNGDNTWTLSVPTALADGIYDVVATATDTAGNSSSDETTDELTIDTTAPTVPTVDALVTNDNTPVITGTADSADDLTVTLDGVTYTEGDGNLTDNGDNTWTLNVSTALADGTYDVVATATDAAGNISTDETTDELTIDTMAPTVPTVTPLVTNNNTPTITGTADSVDDLTVTLDGVTYTEGDGNLTDNGDDTWALEVPSPLADGTYDVVATAIDAAGNSSSDETTDELTIDTMAPTVPTVTPLVTNDNTPTITGTADSADDLVVVVDGVTYTEGDGNLTDNGDDTWTLSVPTALADGTYDVVATATDAAGNLSSDETIDELTIDTISPNVPTVTPLVTNDNTPTITGTADSVDDLTVTIDGVTYTEGDGNLTDNGDNTWTLEVPSPLADGTYDVMATATDVAGNISTDATTDELTIDTMAPTVPTVTPLVTNDNTPTITGTADSADDLTVTVDGVTYTEGDGNLVDNGDNTWTLSVPTALADGIYDVVATTTDAAGNSSSDETIDELTIDTMAPTVPTVTPLVTNDNTPTITGTADSVDDLTVTIDGVTYTEGDGNLTDNGDNTWALDVPSPLADGTYDVVATATDAAGNSSSDETIDELTIDTMAPTVPTVTPLVTNDNTPTITGTADSADDLVVVVEGVTYTEGDGNLTDNGDNTWTLNVPTALADGTYDVVATATDAAGNSSSDETIDELIIDTMAPTVPTVTPLVTNDNTPVITGTADSADDLTVTLDGVTYTEGDGNLTDNGDNTWTLEVPSPLADGTYDVMATATDGAGNSSSDETTDELTIDTMAPTVPTVTPLVTNDNTPTITGTADSVDDLTVTVDGVTYTEGDGNLTDNGDNTWTLDVPSPLADGTYDIVATATDAAGNTSSDETTDELTVTTSVPTGNPLQTFCAVDAPVIADLQLDQTAIVWYDAPSGGTQLDPNTPLEDGGIYYAALLGSGMESINRFAVTVQLTDPVAPAITASDAIACLGTQVTYTTQSGMQDYAWQVSSGGSIVSGGTSTDNFVVVVWDIPGEERVLVEFESDASCVLDVEAVYEVSAVACSDLTITKTVDNPNPVIGENVIYTITVQNNGTVALNLIEVEDRLPDGLEYVSFTTGDGTYVSANGMWSIPELLPNESAVLTMTAKVLDAGNYLNRAVILNSYPLDLDFENNTAQVNLNPDCLLVFNEFSPNGDGMNDLFKIRCIEKYPQNTLKVFNRVGQLVYSIANYQNTWDGMANVNSSWSDSTVLPSGTYYYALEIEAGRTLTGWLYIAN